MTARMQTVRQMAQAAGVSERIMAQGFYVARRGFPGIFNLVFTHALSIPEMIVMVDSLPVVEQEEWAKRSPEDLKRDLKALRRSKTARMRSPVLEDLHGLAAGTLGVQDFLARHKGARIPNGDL